MTPGLSIRTKLFVSILVTLLVAHATLIYTTIHSYSTFISTETARELEQHLNFAQKQLLVRAEQTRTALMNPASSPYEQQFLLTRDRRWLKSAMARWHEILPYAESITVLTPQKVVIARLNNDASGDRMDPGELLDQALTQKKPVISIELVPVETLCREGIKGFCGDRSSHEAMAILVVVPVIKADGTVLGAIIATDIMNRDPFLPHVVKEIFGKETELSITQRGLRIASSYLEDGGEAATLAPEVLSQLQEGKKYTGETEIGGKPYVTVFEPINNSRGSFIGSLSVALPLAELNSIRRETDRNIIVSALVGILLSFTITYLVARKLISPLKELTLGVERIERGELDQKVVVPSRDEFGLLADAFNRMVAKLNERDRTITKKTRDLEELNSLLKELNELLERKVADRTSELRMEMGMLEAILTSMAEGIVVTDAGNKVVLFNPAAQKIFNIVPHRVLHQPVEHLCELSGFSPVLDCIREIRTDEGATSTLEKEMSVSGKTLKVNLSPLLDEAGSFAGVVMSIRDVTVEGEVDRMKTEFISTVSHELKTPLTSIKGALQFIMTKAKWLTGTEQDLLGICFRNTERLIRLINDILDISKIESGRVELDFRPLSVSDVAVYAIEEIKGFALSRNVTIVNGIAECLPPIYADHDRIIQVLTNLLSNSVKFSPEGKVVMVTAEHQDNYVAVSVSDHGKEIQWSARDKLFKKFQQLENSDRDRQGGTGLGLAICKEIIERHHGKIYYNAGTTGGNTFTFTVPIYQEP